MAASQITDGTDTYTFISIRGAFPGSEEKSVTRQMPGVDGTGITRIGAKGVEFTLRTVCDYDTAAAAETAIANYQALAGSICTITDDRSQSHANIAVLEVLPGEPQYLAASVGGTTAGNYIVRAEWRCIDVS